ncbi:hypothetical protein AVEN_88034-1 [Araneus ventricosus]|uniref:Uncharacterized protein n=1 Tax=Araneus ventricosus TaxID=182803 RepID=A0A4Y2L530_ARAVE|nr:hypothetical protein AVEN_88034-1 [Araneus ventricosus]
MKTLPTESGSDLAFEPLSAKVKNRSPMEPQYNNSLKKSNFAPLNFFTPCGGQTNGNSKVQPHSSVFTNHDVDYKTPLHGPATIAFLLFKQCSGPEMEEIS